MSQTCSVCAHADRAAIETAHVEGMSLRGIASKFSGTSAWSLARHFKHIPAIIAKVTAHELQRNIATAKLPARVEELIAEAEAITKSARGKKDWSAALSAIRTRLACLEMVGKLSGELKPGGAGEFVQGNTAAAASVVVNLPAAAPKDAVGFVELLRRIYGLDAEYSRNRAAAAAAKPEPVM